MPTVYKEKGRTVYKTDIWIDGRKFSRSTGKTSEREAKAKATLIEKELRTTMEVQAHAEVSLALDDVAGRYMIEVGDLHVGEGASNTRKQVGRIVTFFGPGTLITDLTHADALRLKSWRAKQKWHGKPLSPFTINDTIEQLKKLLTYCKNRGVAFGRNAPKFGEQELWLEEPVPRPRELAPTESARLNRAAADVRADYEPLVKFSRLTGKRQAECIGLKHTSIKWERDIIQLRGKRNKLLEFPLTPTLRTLLLPLRQHHPVYVFTYIAQRTMVVRQGIGANQVETRLIEGERYPITKAGLRGVWDDIREAGDIPMTGDDRVRWHDLRHDFATKTLRKITSANGMKVVQELLGHAKLETTMKIYAHVTHDDMAAAMEDVADAQLDKNHPQRHPRRKLRVV